MMCLLHRIGDGDRLLEVTGVQLSPSSGSTGSLLLASLPSSFFGSFSDSAELDSSSVSSLFPNKPLSGFWERSKEQSLVVSLDSIGSSGKGSVFLLRCFRLSCLRAYEGLLGSFSFPVRAQTSHFSVKTQRSFWSSRKWRIVNLFQLGGSIDPQLASKEYHCHIRCHTWNQWNLPSWRVSCSVDRSLCQLGGPRATQYFGVCFKRES